MQEYNCNVCNYTTNRLLNFQRHKSSDKHNKNINNCYQNTSSTHMMSSNDVKSNETTIKKSLKDYTCKSCNHTFTHRSNYYRHAKNGCVKNNKSVDGQTISANVIDMFKQISEQNSRICEELNQLSKQVAKHDGKLEEHEKQIVSEKNNILEIAKNNSETVNKSMSVIKRATKYFNNAPPLRSVNKDKIIELLEYKPDGKESDHLIDEVIVFRYRTNSLIKFIGEIIIAYYITEDPKMQSMWGTDISRLTFIFKKSSKTGKSEWTRDGKGVRISEIVIDPIYNEIKKIMREYIEKINKRIKHEILTPIQSEYLLKESELAFEVIGAIGFGEIQKATLREIAPQFGMDSIVLDSVNNPIHEVKNINGSKLMKTSMHTIGILPYKTIQESSEPNSDDSVTNVKTKKKQHIKNPKSDSSSSGSNDSAINIKTKKRQHVKKPKYYSSDSNSDSDDSTINIKIKKSKK